MDVVAKICLNFGFERVSNSLRAPIYIHCVPGAGKSTLIRELVKDPRFFAITAGVPDPTGLVSARIFPAGTVVPSGVSYLICDEYTEWRGDLPEAAIYVGDPVQSAKITTAHPHFVCERTRRFGAQTCKFLRALGYSITSDGEDECILARVRDIDPEGIVLVCGPEAKSLCCYYRIEFKEAEEVRGSTFDVVTLVTDFSELPQERRAEFFVCATRHRKKLIVANSDASLTAS